MPHSHKWFSFTPLLGRTAQIKNFLIPQVSEAVWTAGDSSHQLGDPGTGSSGDRPRPSEARPQSAMRPQRRALCPQGQLPFLNPEQSAALATVQVGKTAPQGAPGDTRCARRSRDHGHRERRPPPRRGLDTQVLASAPSLPQRLGADGAATRI